MNRLFRYFKRIKYSNIINLMTNIALFVYYTLLLCDSNTTKFERFVAACLGILAINSLDD